MNDNETWYQMETVDEDFFRTAPLRHRHVIDLPTTPERVFEQIASDESLSAWGVGLKLHWTSPRPFGVGTTREATLPGGLVLRERFFRWDEGAGYSFAGVEANRPTYVRFAEDYRVEPRPGGARLTWVMAMEPPPGIKGRMTTLADFLTGPMYQVIPLAAKRYFKKHP